MKKYTFKIDNTAKTTTNPSNTYSEIIDNIISSNVIKNNPWFATIDDTPKRKKNINIKDLDVFVNQNNIKTF